ncbi:MAG: trigger factor [Myxococcales bacterium]|nr:trigger factor [Myxococcales bacterium]
MDPRIDHVSPTVRRLTFTVPAARVGQALDRCAQRLASKAQVRGFRPGKVPVSLIERMYAPELRRDALDLVLDDVVREVLLGAALPVAGSPEIDNLGELRRGSPLDVSFTIEVFPDLHLTGWEGAALEYICVAVAEADIDQALQDRRSASGEWAAAPDGARDGDEVVLDYSLQTVAQEPGNTVAGLPPARADETVTRRRAVLGQQTLPAPIEAAVRGLHAGATAEHTHDDEGRVRRVSVTLHEVERKVLPALDDEFAKDLSFANLAELRADATRHLEREAERRTRESRTRAAVAHLLAANPFEVPAAAVERLADSSLMDMLGGMKNNPDMVKRMLRALRPTMLPVATATLKRSLAVEAIADQLAVTISDEDVATHVENMVARAPAVQRAQVRRELEAADRAGVKVRLREERAVDALIAAASWSVVATQSVDAARTAEAAARAGGAPDADGANDPAANDPEVGAHAMAGAHVHGPDCDHDHDPSPHAAAPGHGAAPVPAP